MRNVLLFILSLSSFACFAQEVPVWYTLSGRNSNFPANSYVTGFSIDKPQNGESYEKAAERLVRSARVKAVSIIQVKVENETEDKLASFQQKGGNGAGMAQTRSTTSVSKSSVNMEISNLKVESYIDRTEGKVAAFAYIKINDLIRQTDRKLTSLLSKVESGLDEIDELIANGEKIEAKKRLEKIIPLFDEIDSQQRILIAVDPYADEESLQMSLCKTLQQRASKLQIDLKNGINIYLNCKADMLGTNYPTLGNTIKGDLSKLGATFVTSPDQADWAIVVNANSRQYNAHTIGGYTTYFVYVDASITIDKMATGQRIYEDALSEKGGHTKNYTEAARDGYKQITPKLTAVINQYIKQ